LILGKNNNRCVGCRLKLSKVMTQRLKKRRWRKYDDVTEQTMNESSFTEWGGVNLMSCRSVSWSPGSSMSFLSDCCQLVKDSGPRDLGHYDEANHILLSRSVCARRRKHGDKTREYERVIPSRFVPCTLLPRVSRWDGLHGAWSMERRRYARQRTRRPYVEICDESVKTLDRGGFSSAVL
jgi:hypothetical protein